MKKMLITGASGFLGSKVATYYQDKYEILAPSHAEMDITNEDSVSSYFAENKPDIVIHCAAVSDVGNCEREKEYSWKVNVTGSENIARASKMVSAKCVLCSSDQVYCGSSVEEAHREDESLTPGNTYGQEKLYAENSCLKMNGDSVHLRLSWMYDANDTKYLGRGDFVRILREGILTAEGVTFSVNDHRGITDVWEVVKNFEKALELPGGVYNFGASNDKNTYETVRELFGLLHYDTAKLHKSEEPAGAGVRNLSMSQEKLNHFGVYFSSTVEGVYRNMVNESLSVDE